jgi:hypothetical protein
MNEGVRSILTRFVDLTKALYWEDDPKKRSEIIRQLRSLASDAEGAMRDE